MKQVLDQEPDSQPSPIPSRRPQSILTRLLQGALYIFLVLALFAGGGLLVSDLAPQLLVSLPHAPISAAPLLLIGTASLGYLVLARPRLWEAFKAFLVSLAFLLWGIDQLLAPGWLATMLGDGVIVLYVIDLGWMIGAALRTHRREM